MTNKRLYTRVFFFFIFILISSCAIAIVGSTAVKEKGMIQGKVLSPSIENNLIIWTGLSNVTVTVKETGAKVKTLVDGSYLIEGLENGAYTLTAHNFLYGADQVAVIAIKGYLASAPDLLVGHYDVSGLNGFLNGKIYQSDRISYLPNATIKLYGTRFVSGTGYLLGNLIDSTVTSSSGDYVFYEPGSSRYIITYNGSPLRFPVNGIDYDYLYLSSFSDREWGSGYIHTADGYIY